MKDATKKISATADISNTDINYISPAALDEQKKLMEIILRTGEAWAGLLQKTSAALRHYRSGRNEIPDKVLLKIEHEIISALILAKKIREGRKC